MKLTRTRIGVALVAAAVATMTTVIAAPAHAAGPYTLRVYSNNIENLVTNQANDACVKVSGTDHLNSILADSSAPDILILQQVRGAGQISAYADQVSARFGYAAGTYKYVVAADDPEEWGASHDCSDTDLGNYKKKQTNGIIYNSKTLTLTDTSNYWSAGWLPTGASATTANCKLYKPDNGDGTQSNDPGGSYYKYKRTWAIAAGFTYKATGTTVAASTQHLAESNQTYPCGGYNNTGIASTGISVGGTASTILNNATVRIMGMDANKTSISSSALNSAYGVTGYGVANTFDTNGGTNTTKKIDYLFVKGTVQSSGTMQGTKSNHKAIYTFITL